MIIRHRYERNFAQIVKSDITIYKAFPESLVCWKVKGTGLLGSFLGKINNNNNELYLHDHTKTYSIAKAMFRNQNYNTGQLRYFDNNLSRTSKQNQSPRATKRLKR